MLKCVQTNEHCQSALLYSQPETCTVLPNCTCHHAQTTFLPYTLLCPKISRAQKSPPSLSCITHSSVKNTQAQKSTPTISYIALVPIKITRAQKDKLLRSQDQKSTDKACVSSQPKDVDGSGTASGWVSSILNITRRGSSPTESTHMVSTKTSTKSTIEPKRGCILHFFVLSRCQWPQQSWENFDLLEFCNKK